MAAEVMHNVGIVRIFMILLIQTRDSSRPPLPADPIFVRQRFAPEIACSGDFYTSPRTPSQCPAIVCPETQAFVGSGLWVSMKEIVKRIDITAPVQQSRCDGKRQDRVVCNAGEWYTRGVGYDKLRRLVFLPWTQRVVRHGC